jgi:hypothetical protein
MTRGSPGASSLFLALLRLCGHDEVARVPGERRGLTPIGRTAFGGVFIRGRASVGTSAVPQHFDREIGRLLFQLVKSANRATAHDEGNRFAPRRHKLIIGCS